MKCGSVGSGGIRGDFDNLTVVELDFSPGGVTPAALLDAFDDLELVIEGVISRAERWEICW